MDKHDPIKKTNKNIKTFCPKGPFTEFKKKKKKKDEV